MASIDKRCKLKRMRKAYICDIYIWDTYICKLQLRISCVKSKQPRRTLSCRIHIKSVRVYFLLRMEIKIILSHILFNIGITESRAHFYSFFQWKSYVIYQMIKFFLFWEKSNISTPFSRKTRLYKSDLTIHLSFIQSWVLKYAMSCGFLTF